MMALTTNKNEKELRKMINKEEIWEKVLGEIKSSVSLSNYKIFFDQYGL